MAAGDEVPRDATREQRLIERPSDNSPLAQTDLTVIERSRIDMPHTNDEDGPQTTALHSPTGHIPSPNRYEFALNGLLALSGTESTYVPSTRQFHLPESASRQELSTPNADALPMDDRFPRGDAPVQHVWQTGRPSRIRMSGEPDHGIAVNDYAVFGANSAGIMAYEHVPRTADNERAAELGLNATDLANPTWSASPGVVPTYNGMDLIRAYRYQIAPWVSPVNERS